MIPLFFGLRALRNANFNTDDSHPIKTARDQTMWCLIQIVKIDNQRSSKEGRVD